MADFFADGQDSSQLTYKPSSHLFTEPIRYFKANDPYYWEVDNIPIKQVQENILWLKDQVGQVGETEGTFGRRDFNELLPSAAGDTNVVTVSPGKFMGRVNDAYGTGISKLKLKAWSDYADGKYNTDLDVDIEDTLLRTIIGQTVNKILGNNGLYDVLQHHVTNPIPGTIQSEWNEEYGTFTQNMVDVGDILSIPKIKLALWKQDTTTHNYPGITTAYVDLQQLSVDFTRAWGAPFRTALVNVENQLSIKVPPFDNADYMNNSTYLPSIRIDLLFVYTKPIDASSTHIARPNGSDPVEITSPQLGIVKGAGVISLYGQGPNWPSDPNSQPANSEFLGDNSFLDRRDKPENFFGAAGGLDGSGNNQISSPLGDQNQTSMGTSGVYGNFPSPDDLMNLAPYIVNEIQGTQNLALVGQSILPIAYIFVKRGAATITNSDILDIRPFFRTAELTYNERAGLAAANPPTSLANPVVTNSDLVHRLELFNANLPEPPTNITFQILKNVWPEDYLYGGTIGTPYVIVKDGSWNAMGGAYDNVKYFGNKNWDVTEAIEANHREGIKTIFLMVNPKIPSGKTSNTNTLKYSACGMPFKQEICTLYGDYDHATLQYQMPICYDATTQTISFNTAMGGNPESKNVVWTLQIRGYSYEETIVIGTGS